MMPRPVGLGVCRSVQFRAADHLLQGIRTVGELLSDERLEPLPGREIGSDGRSQVEQVRRTVESHVLGVLAPAVAETEDADQERSLRNLTASCLGAAAALLLAAGDRWGFGDWVGRAHALADDPDLAAELAAGRKEPESYCCLVHARWLASKARGEDAAAVLVSLRARTRMRALRNTAEREIRLLGHGAGARLRHGWGLALISVTTLAVVAVSVAVLLH